MNYEKAAQALAEAGYAEYGYVTFSYTDGIYLACEAMVPWICEKVDPLNNEAQRQALLEWFEVQVHKISVNDWYAQSGFCKTSNFTAHGRHGVSRIEAENKCIEACLDDG